MEKETLNICLNHLMTIPEFITFWDSYQNSAKIEKMENLFQFLDEFSNHLNSKNKFTNEIENMIAIVKEQSQIINYKKDLPIFAINKAIKINDGWINDFRKDFANCFTNDEYFEQLPSRYKTITEYLSLKGVDGNKLSEIYQKYEKYDHPFVNYTIGNLLVSSKLFSQGIPFYKAVLLQACTYPNYYWHNEYAVLGCALTLGAICYLIKKDNKNLIKLLKLAFLYFSRYIYMTNKNLYSIDIYSIRADFVKYFFMDFIGIFEMGVNPDIQYISDKYLAYLCCRKHNLNFEFCRAYHSDALKMYEHGSSIPNSSGGYKEIEDGTIDELVNQGNYRSIKLSCELLNEFENYELNISNYDICTICNYIIDNNSDDFENYLSKLKKKVIL